MRLTPSMFLGAILVFAGPGRASTSACVLEDVFQGKLHVVDGEQASGPLADFDNRSYESVASAVAEMAANADALHVPLRLEEAFDTLELPVVTIATDGGKKSIVFQGTHTLRGKPFTLLLSAHWGQRAKPHVALTIKGPSFEGFFPAGGPLDGLATSTAWFIIAAEEFDLKSEDLPPIVEDFYGDNEISLQPGLNLFSKVIPAESPAFAGSLGWLRIHKPWIELQGYHGGSVKNLFKEDEKIELNAKSALSATVPIFWHTTGTGVELLLKGTVGIGADVDVGGFESTEAEVELAGKWRFGLAAEVEVPEAMTAKLSGELEAGLDVDGQEVQLDELVFEMEAEASFPFLTEDGLVGDLLGDELGWTGQVTIKRESEQFEGTGEAEIEFSRKGDVTLTPIGALFNLHPPKVKMSFPLELGSENEESPKAGKDLAIEIACEFDALGYEDVGQFSLGFTVSGTDDTSSGESTGESQIGKWKGSAKFEPAALKNMEAKELLASVGELPDDVLDPVLDFGFDALSMQFTPGEADSMVFYGTATILGSPTHLFAARVEQTDGKNGVILGLRPEVWSVKQALPNLSLPVLDELELHNVALLFSTIELHTSADEVSEEEFAFYSAVYQHDDFAVSVMPGLNIVAAVPIEDMDPESPLASLMDSLGIERGTALLQGTLGTQVQNCAVRVSLPPMSPPGAPNWFVEGQIDLEVTGQPSLAVIGSMDVRLEDDVVSFQLQASGGSDGLSLTGGLVAEDGWDSPFGVEWLLLNKTLLTFGVTPTGSLKPGFETDLVIGTKDVQVTVVAYLNAATGVPTNFMFEGGSEAGLAISDLAELQARIAKARTGKTAAIPLSDLPDLSVDQLYLKFAPKDSLQPPISRGLAIRGRLGVTPSPNAPKQILAEVDFDVSEDGITALGAIADRELGAVSLTGAELDLALNTDDQHFVLHGSGDLGFLHKEIHIQLDKTQMSFSTTGQAFGLFMTELDAVGKADLENPDFVVDGTFQNDFHTVFESAFTKALLDEAAQRVATAQSARNAAQSAYDKAKADANAAYKAWLKAPLKQKAAARNKWISLKSIAAKKALAIPPLVAQLAAWTAVQQSIELASTAGKLLSIQSATFHGDLAGIKTSSAVELDVVAVFLGQEIQLHLSQFDPHAIGSALVAEAKKRVEERFHAQ